jgi:hypothetical protein
MMPGQIMSAVTLTGGLLKRSPMYSMSNRSDESHEGVTSNTITGARSCNVQTDADGKHRQFHSQCSGD